MSTITGKRLLVGLLPFLLLVGTGCSRMQTQASDTVAATGADVPQDERVPVAAMPIGRGRIESVLRYSTNLEAENQVEVYSEASRRVMEILSEEGDRVAKGQVLLRLQSDEQESAVAKVESQLAQARREFERQQSLFEQELISEQTFHDASYAKEQLELEYEDSRRELAYTEVRAPIAGVVKQRLVGLGDFVQDREHLFDLVDFESIVARVYVPEKELARLTVGQEARLFASALGEQAREARILRIAPTVDERTGTVKVTLEMPDRSALRPGMYVEVELVADVDSEALLVPKRALVYDQDQSFVYKIDAENRARRVRVEALIEDRDFIKVGDRLAEGDRIVVAGQAGLKDGVEVRLLELDEALATFADQTPGR
jgi:membrane fusion protein (multidrug efflux system)